MEYLSREIQKFEEDKDRYVLEGDFTEEEIHIICEFFEMAPIIRKITIEPVDYDFKIFLNEHITGIVNIAISKDPDTIPCFNQPDFYELIDGVFELAAAKGYKKLYWNNILILVTQEHIQDIQKELEKYPDKKTQKKTTKIHRRYLNNMRLH